MAKTPPQVNAFILCDQAFQQAQTGKWCIIGTFAVVWTREFPAMHAPLTVFLGLSDYAGDSTLQVVLRNPDGKTIYAVRGQIPRIPMGMVELAFPFPPVRFEGEGVYTAELVDGSQLLAVRSFHVKKAPPQPQTPIPPVAPN